MANIPDDKMTPPERGAWAQTQRKNVGAAVKRVHAATRTALGAGGPVGATAAHAVRADPAGRVSMRMALISARDPLGLERVLGTRDIVGINFLRRGLEAARAVCRIKVVGMDGAPPYYGTGFLIAPGLVLTNNHVLPDADTAAFALAEFGYELDLNWVEGPRHICAAVPSQIFFTDTALDFSIVAIAPVAQDGTPTSTFGTLKLIPDSGKALVGEHVSIIQHPEGGPKQVVLRENRIVRLDPKLFADEEIFIHYTADTEAGSSGSPIFNDQWDLVGLHHMAIADRLRDGQPKNRLGKLWTLEQGDAARAWIANEGVRASAIVRSIRVSRSEDVNAGKIAAILAFEPPLAMRSPLRGDDLPPTGSEIGAVLSNQPDLEAYGLDRYTSAEYRKTAGFDPKFLGSALIVPLPKLGKGKPADTLFTPKGAKTPVLDYTHFSLAMHRERKLPMWTAVNIDGGAAYTKPVKDGGWRQDPRAGDCQTFGAVYGKDRGGTSVQIDKGHQVRRLDPVWGPPAVAANAAADTFHYTNAVPQEHGFNSEIWGNLEDYVLAGAINKSRKASVLTGPVLRIDDNVFGEGVKGGPWKIPWSFWKICCFVRPDGTVSVTGFTIEQTGQISPLFEATRFNPFTVDQVKVYQRPIRDLEQIAGLDFGPLRKLDRMGQVEATGPNRARILRDPGDVVL